MRTNVSPVFLYQTLLDAPDVPEGLHRTAHDVAVAVGSDELLSRIVQHPQAPDSLVEKIERDSATPTVRAAVAVRAQVLAGSSGTSDERCNLAQYASDPDVLEAIVSHMEAAAPNTNPTTLGRLILNPHVSTTQRRRVANVVAAVCASGALLGKLAELNVFALPNADPYVCFVWTATFPAQVLRAHGWAPFGGSSASVDVVTRAWRTRCADPDDSNAKGVFHSVVQGPGMPVDALGALPWGAVEHLLVACQAHGDVVLPVAVVAHLKDALGSSSDAWRTFERLRQEFPGTFDELMTTCTTVTT